MYTNKQLNSKLTKKYVIALLIIAILSTLAYYMLNKTLKESNHTGKIVNISGKQRMLSQRIALDVHIVHDSLYEESEKNNLIEQRLIDSIDEMLIANERLTTGKLSNEDTYVLSSSIKNMYFGKTNVDKRVKEYAKVARQSLGKTIHKNADEIKNKIDFLSKSLLVDLNKIVIIYEKEGQEKLESMHKIETIAWIVTILVLLLEVIFIFQPMVREIITLTQQRDSTLQNLENTVELRTMHLEQANEKLSHLASHDPLTGLKNRLNFEQDIEKTIDMNKKHNAPYAVIMIDIDWFKKVNDEFGHDIGDIVLKEFASILKSTLRMEDKIYRAGGEEFVIILDRITYEYAFSIAEKVRLKIENHIFNVEGKTFSKTISCGVYHSSFEKDTDIKRVLKLVDTALYEAKKTGRNKICEAIID